MAVQESVSVISPIDPIGLRRTLSFVRRVLGGILEHKVDGDALAELRAVILKSLAKFEGEVDALETRPGFDSLYQVCLSTRLLTVSMCDVAVFVGEPCQDLIEQFQKLLHRCLDNEHESLVAIAIRQCGNTHEEELAKHYLESIRHRAKLARISQALS